MFWLFYATLIVCFSPTLYGQNFSSVVTRTEEEASKSLRRTSTASKTIAVGKNKDACAAQWREDNLAGRCFGIGPYYEMFPELQNAARAITTARACKRACCKLGPQCVTWQFGGGKKHNDCRMGGPVRFGDEASGVSGWCEPSAPREWEGFKVRREGAVCTAHQLIPGQCFGLGPEVLSERKERLSVKQCEEKCCADPMCNMWQALPDRGCYLSPQDVWCDPTVQAYTGSRKCAKGFCGGRENELESFVYPRKTD